MVSIQIAIFLGGETMFIIHVQVQVKPPFIDAFKKACIETAKESIKLEGIVRLDIVQQQDDPSHFILIEVYRNRDVPSRLKETSHYRDWRDKVLPMMAQPRKSTFFTNVYPDDKNWT